MRGNISECILRTCRKSRYTLNLEGSRLRFEDGTFRISCISTSHQNMESAWYYNRTFLKDLFLRLILKTFLDGEITCLYSNAFYTSKLRASVCTCNMNQTESWNTGGARWLMQWFTNRKVADSISLDIPEIFHVMAAALWPWVLLSRHSCHFHVPKTLGVLRACKGIAVPS